MKINFQDRSRYYDLKSLRDKIIIKKEIGGLPNIRINKYEYTINNSYLKLLNYKPLKPEKVRDDNYKVIRECTEMDFEVE